MAKNPYVELDENTVSNALLAIGEPESWEELVKIGTAVKSALGENAIPTARRNTTFPAHLPATIQAASKAVRWFIWQTNARAARSRAKTHAEHGRKRRNIALKKNVAAPN